MHYGHVTARAFIAGIFLVSGFGKLTGVQETAADIAALGLPLPVLAAVMAGIVELVCGACLALGLKTAWAAAGLLVFMVPVTLLFEHPFRGPGAIYDFLKNLAIMGGLLLALLGELDAMGVTGKKRGGGDSPA